MVSTSASTALQPFHGEALHRRAGRIVWLNPLMGDARCRPTAAGMSAALPYVDHFAPAHNLESLESLLRVVK